MQAVRVSRVEGNAEHGHAGTPATTGCNLSRVAAARHRPLTDPQDWIAYAPDRTRKTLRPWCGRKRTSAFAQSVRDGVAVQSRHAVLSPGWRLGQFSESAPSRSNPST
jgi:hypothetical protein